MGSLPSARRNPSRRAMNRGSVPHGAATDRAICSMGTYREYGFTLDSASWIPWSILTPDNFACICMPVARENRPARAALIAWLAVPGRRQTALAEAVGVTQQYVSAIQQERGPVPSERLRDLLHLATRGAVSRGEWLTPAEVREEDAARDRARAFARSAAA